ncbi:ETS-related transcription factor Elf-3 isoform X2 [Pteropus alecto]|uniref:ETS-related transcription factor Elf-3 isoform X2 n=1 Tax=Pteropus alecto TaxID=9402 RepID=UPI000D538976|nr:ETS-related transcription factor Elf-3 isoform X2 [Pteropus alecto]XP_039739507.1 ETS-related transcription factor Elf-3 isoform X2 [Pteropus giganteus]
MRGCAEALKQRARRREPSRKLGAPSGPFLKRGFWRGGLMAATCEISNVFSNYFSTMYSPEDPALASVPPATTFGADDLLVSLSNPQMPLEGTEKASWSGEQPQFWSKAQVLDWISYQVERNKIDASAIDFSRCDMDGATLCSCAPEELRLVFGPLGDQLYSQLWDMTSSFPDELTWIIDLLEKDSVSFQETLGDPGPAGTGSSRSPRCSDSGGSDLDLDPGDSRLLCSEGCADHKKGEPKHGKRKRGRPRKLSREPRDCLEGRKSKHAPRGTHLWEFIRDILIQPELNEGLMKWEDRQEGVFKFLRSEAVAQLWGQKKRNSSMTYEKLSRAMRYYYKRDILERVDGRRLVYKFGKNSSGWKEEEVVGSQD